MDTTNPKGAVEQCPRVVSSITTGHRQSPTATENGDSDEELPDLYAMWTRDCSYPTSNISNNPASPRCEDISDVKNSESRSPVSPKSSDGASFSLKTRCSGNSLRESIDCNGPPIQRSENLPVDGSSHPIPSGEDTPCPASDIPCIVSREALPINGPSENTATGKKFPSLRRIEQPTFSDNPSILKYSYPVCQQDGSYSHSKSETKLKEISDRLNPQIVNQPSSFETDKHSFNGITGETVRKNGARVLYCNENSVSPIITGEELQAIRMFGDTTIETLNHTLTEADSHHVLNNVNSFSLSKEDIEISEPFICKDQSFCCPHSEGKCVPICNQGQGYETSLFVGKYPDDQNKSMNCAMYVNSSEFQGYEESEAQSQKISNTMVAVPLHTNLMVDICSNHYPINQTGMDISNMGCRGGEPFSVNDESSDCEIVGEYSYFPWNKDSVVQAAKSLDQGSKDVCSETLLSVSSGYETQNNDCDFDEVTPGTNTVAKPIKMVIKKSNGTYTSHLLRNPEIDGNHAEPSHFYSGSSVGSRAGLPSYRKRKISGDQSCMETESGNTSSDSTDGEMHDFEKYCRRLSRSMENLRRERQEKIKARQRMKEEYEGKVKELRSNMVRLKRSHRHDMETCFSEIQAIDQRIQETNKYLLKGKRVLQDVVVAGTPSLS